MSLRSILTSIGRSCVITLAIFGIAHGQSVSLNGATVDTYFSPNGGASEAAVEMINLARDRVMLAGYGFTNRTIAQALKRANDRGVSVRVVLDRSNQRSTYTGATYLVNAGVNVCLDFHYPIMHQKFIVADDMMAFGSMNFTQAGNTKNSENFNIFHGAHALVTESV